ncbi:MAG: hydantoinase/oxoprolinase family protein, partial [Chloroflexi bacterium]|nr:hydantoinase/oxoprolinase family protein [Chloroflexota bacterium]
VKRGLDVRDYVLVAFGGSGPLQAGKLLDILGLKAALVPPSPGNVSAFGLLTVDIKNDFVTTAVQKHDLLDLDRVNGDYERLESHARQTLAAEGFAADEMQITRSADMRYFGQAWEVRVDVPAGTLDRTAADLAVEHFHTAHQQTYSYAYRDNPDQRVEWVNFRVIGVGPIGGPVIQPQPHDQAAGIARARVASRPVYFDAGLVETPIYDRGRLQPGDCVVGPAIVEEFGSTTVVFPGLAARVDAYGNLVLERAR